MGGWKTSKVRHAISPPDKLAPVAWIERHIFLSADLAAQPGQYSFARVPFWRDVANAAADPSVEEVCVVKGTQIGWSQLLRAVLGWLVDQEPGPLLYVMPSEAAARQVVEERIRPLIDSAPIMQSHLSGDSADFTKSYVRFDSMPVFMGWAGSPQALASRPCRYIFLDESEKFPPFSGREADPKSLARERTATFGYRKKIFDGSTPALRTGPIWRSFEACDDQRCFFVPCPHCRHYQRLLLTGLKWPEHETKDRARRASLIELDDSAYYECAECKGQILERDRGRMLAAGVWVSGRLNTDGTWTPTQSVAAAGDIQGDRPRAKRVGFWINALYSPWRTFSAVAAEFMRSQGDMAKMQNFKNSWMAEPFEEQVGAVKSADIAAMRTTAPLAGVVPPWAQILTLTADVQKEGKLCYFVVRAWGAGYKSQLVDFGTTPGIDALTPLLNALYPVGTPSGAPMPVALMLIDAGYKTDLVYEYAATDPRIVPIMGARNESKHQQPLRQTVGHKGLGIMRWDVATNYYKDVLKARRAAGLWLVNSGITDEYCQQQASEHQVIDRRTGRIVWVPVSQGVANHFLDVEVYQQAAADIVGVNLFVERDGETATEAAAVEDWGGRTIQHAGAF